ncbi:TetR/AcrR family transcriptional regulator [Dyadobacter sp. CY356]|uniref:TetR/AcrR family transcriptional regulator n=1 Tax=Dyadobacter sp. CY356 TaxID=2906442 RepID=UPI001F45AFFB|nr:TetR family transcriptional regulator [Dyadobacter sp. CY356]MCF0054951.1 TetR family transcriptional regulator [Dyadobacter sp. CY356]
MKYNPKQLKIIEIAEKLFSEKGFSGTSIRDISQEAEVNVSMISYYFGSKEKLIEALFSLRSHEFISKLDYLLKDLDLSPVQKVNLMIDWVINRLIEKQCFHNVVLREQLAGDSRTPIISDLLDEMKSNNLAAMTKIIEEGQLSGEFKSDVDVLMLSTTLFGTINQAISTQRFYRKVNGLQNATQQDLENHLRQKLSVHLKKFFHFTLVQELNHIIDG